MSCSAIELSPPSARTRRQMQAQKSSGTGIEMEVRRALHARGYRYRVDRKLLAEYPWRGDIAWSGRRLVLFLDGCFWHGCSVHRTTPRSNADWWRAKIDGNRARDQRVDKVLREHGWTVLRFWEHDNIDEIVASVISHLDR